MKHCNGCDEDKELTGFNFRKSGRSMGKPYSQCKECEKMRSNKWYYDNIEKAKATRRIWTKANLDNVKNRIYTWQRANPDKVKQYHRTWSKANPDRVRKLRRDGTYRHGAKPASENKSCSAYLGIVIAETVLSHEFPGFKRMPNNNPGYDYDCSKGFKIDVKSSCRRHRKNGNDYWGFAIKKNKLADYFLCIAFDNRKNLNPEHIWLIPGNMISNKSEQGITDLLESLAKWSQYERSLTNVLECCNALKGEIKK